MHIIYLQQQHFNHKIMSHSIPSIESFNCKFIRLNGVLKSDDRQVWEVFVEMHPKKLSEYGFLDRPEVNDDCNYLEVEFCTKDSSVEILSENNYANEMRKLIEIAAAGAINESLEYYAKK